MKLSKTNRVVKWYVSYYEETYERNVPSNILAIVFSAITLVYTWINDLPYRLIKNLLPSSVRKIKAQIVHTLFSCYIGLAFAAYLSSSWLNLELVSFYKYLMLALFVIQHILMVLILMYLTFDDYAQFINLQAKALKEYFFKTTIGNFVHRALQYVHSLFNKIQQKLIVNWIN